MKTACPSFSVSESPGMVRYANMEKGSHTRKYRMDVPPSDRQELKAIREKKNLVRIRTNTMCTAMGGGQTDRLIDSFLGYGGIGFAAYCTPKKKHCL